MKNLILCGGSGTRLWPLSRKLYPKQFVPLMEGGSLYQMTVLRNAAQVSSVCVVTSVDHYFMAMDQYNAIAEHSRLPEPSFILEPAARNTAPAIALACLDSDPEDIILVTPSDHIIPADADYFGALSAARAAAEKGNLVTFGIKPLYPETGYGYIEADVQSLAAGAMKVSAFREKPDAATAQSFVSAGNFFWNSGMFVFKAGVFLDELKRSAPAIFAKSLEAYESADIIEKSTDQYRNVRVTKEAMCAIPADSIDYAVMEKSGSVMTVPSSFSWNDLGSFDALYDVKPKDAAGNTVADGVINIGSSNNLVMSRNRKIALVGIEDAIIIDTQDAILVGRRGHSQDVKKAVEQLQAGSIADQDLTVVHATAHRPWGTYTVLDDSGSYKIKKIVVRPGHRLSLQKHLHRSEHWVVVSGTAKVTVGDTVTLVRKNESTYIPIGIPHRLENEGKIDLVIIETQVGEYVGEDDIIRIEDDFRRIELNS